MRSRLLAAVGGLILVATAASGAAAAPQPATVSHACVSATQGEITVAPSANAANGGATVAQVSVPGPCKVQVGEE